MSGPLIMPSLCPLRRAGVYRGTGLPPGAHPFFQVSFSKHDWPPSEVSSPAGLLDLTSGYLSQVDIIVRFPLFWKYGN